MLLYVEPGIGLLVLQAIIAALASVWLYLKKPFRFFKKNPPDSQQSDE